MDPAGFVREFVRDHDPDRYFASLFVPSPKRADFLALQAFDTEIATLRGKVREPMAGEIRLRWWRDQLGAPAEIVSGHPVADALRSAIDRNRLPLSAFETYLDARIFDLYDDGFPSRGDLEAYCGETSGAILQLGALILNPELAPEAANASGHGGCMETIARPLAGRSGADRLRPFLPGDLLSAVDLERSGFGAVGNEARSKAAVDGMLAIAREHRDAFLRAVAKMPDEVRPIFLPLAPALTTLDRLEAGSATPGRLRRQWDMTRVAVRGWPRVDANVNAA